ncbi:hypothetical protein L2E82_05065 [Cichorium intybus]|uniref:Uncharacterized protein n=1 Tax=Cichorium intybus TaxID=13427 RepID=A0ACB9H6G1_CICIN|nr:hypothetical protein L2E82_05065 [Cichorium intybus]
MQNVRSYTPAGSKLIIVVRFKHDSYYTHSQPHGFTFNCLEVQSDTVSQSSSISASVTPRFSDHVNGGSFSTTDSLAKPSELPPVATATSAGYENGSHIFGKQNNCLPCLNCTTSTDVKRKSSCSSPQIGLQNILALLQSADLDVQTHAVKVVAKLAVGDINQEKIVQEGGLDALLILIRTSQNTTLFRVASGAIANLAMNELNQGLIMGKGGAALLALTSSKTDDPQTLRMVVGVIANLCGNEKLHLLLIEQGGVRALLGMVRSGNNDVIAQVARRLANFAKWDFVTSGGVKQLARILVESSRDDIRNLAKKILRLNRAFQAEGLLTQLYRIRQVDLKFPPKPVVSIAAKDLIGQVSLSLCGVFSVLPFYGT